MKTDHESLPLLVLPRPSPRFPACRAALGCRAGDAFLDRGLAGHRVVGDGEFGGFEALDLVAEAGGGLEFEVGGGFLHAVFEVGDMGAEIVADEALVGLARIHADMVALVHAFENVADILADRFRCDAVFLVIGELLLAAAFRLGHGAFERAGDVVRIENDAAIDVSRGAADGLDE